MNFTTRPLSEHTGTEFVGVDLSKPMPERLEQAIRDQVIDRGVVVIRGQKLEPDQFVSLSRSFGELEAYGSTLAEYLMPGYPDVVLISNIVENGKRIGVMDAGQFWHTDRSYVPKPAWSSLLYAIEVPFDASGKTLGQTQFANMVAACSALPPDTVSDLSGRKGWHEYVYRFTKRDAADRLPGVEQPIILKHPISGKQCLYVNPGFTHRVVGMPEDESREMLDRLFAHAQAERFIYTHQWAVGDVIMWDNYSVQHHALSNYERDQRRLIWRTTVSGFDIQ